MQTLESSNPTGGILQERIHAIFRKSLKTETTNKVMEDELSANEPPPSLKCARVLHHYFMHANDPTFSGEFISLKFPFSHMANQSGSSPALEEDAMIETLSEQLSQIALQGGGGG
ncbi:unnamed protein product [Phytomonas sp. Hart1]|nr:unnamed protein product [Phytomonas sp. Hart1]|eukprot:CCW70144.1 unnamed protein product [Phytomonas sp. isolate Hart1]